MQIQDALSYFDNGLSTLNGAHFGLYYGSIRELGSEAVQNKWLPLADTFEVPGCFALTGSLLFFSIFFMMRTIQLLNEALILRVAVLKTVDLELLTIKVALCFYILI